MRFIVIEGLDGSGKSTQVSMLRAYLDEKKIKYKYLHFPRLEEGVYGKLVARFLRGEMGANDQVDPYLVALIFAGDRLDAKTLMENWMKDEYLVIVDRFVYSNIAFQCAKLDSADEREELASWIMELEFENHKLPVPEVSVLLDVPFSFTRKRLSAERSGDDRDYLKGQEDIHEKDLGFQEKVREVYHSICARNENLSILDCSDGKGEMRGPEEIFVDLKTILKI